MSFSDTQTLEQALERPFEEYLEWCRRFVADLMRRDPTAAAVLCIGGVEAATLREAMWARRYFFHHALKIQTVAGAPVRPAGA